MKALHFDGKLKLVHDYPEPIPAKGEALVRVLAAGVCSTDLEILKGYMGFTGVPGHEFVGIVEEGPNPEHIGRRVVGGINCSCNACPFCLSGLTRHCPERTVLGIQGRDGAFAERLALPDLNLHLLPEQVSDEEGVFVEPLAAAYQVLEQVHLRPTDHVVVLGDGRLGLLVAQVLRNAGGDVLLVGRHQAKLDLAGELGLRALPEGEVSADIKADLVVEATGTAGGLDMARRMVRPCGTIVLKSTVAEPARIDQSTLVIDEVTVIGSRCGPFFPAIRALESGAVQVKPLIGAVVPVTDGPEGLERAMAGGAIKVLIRFG